MARYEGRPGEPGTAGTDGGGTGGTGGKGGDGGSRWQFIAFALLMTYIAIGVTFVILNSGLNQGEKERAQVCEFVDAEHDAKRVDLAKEEYETFNPPAETTPDVRAFLEQFTRNPKTREYIHENNRKAYNLVIQSRPPYCFDVRPRVLPAYPSLADFEDAHAKPTPQERLRLELAESRKYK